MVANRACAPSSKLYCYEQWLREEVRIDGTESLALHHLYRAMDLLEAHKEDIEKALYFRLADLLNLDVELIFYDTTSLHFEIDEIDQGEGDDDLVAGSIAAGSKTYQAPRKRGMSKNGRSDAPQIVIGLAVTRDGLPVRHWVFPGNTVDVSTVAQVKDDLKGWQLSRCVFVGDAGMVSQDNLDRLSKSGGKYILCMPMRRGDEVTHEVLQRPGRFQKVSDNLRVKEVMVGEGERRRRYVVCHNPQEEKRQRLQRRQVLWELEAELASLQQMKGESHSKRVCQLRSSRRYGRYLRLTQGGLLRIDAAKRRAAEQLDGKFVVHSNDDSLRPADLALGYKQLQRVEEAWRTLKSGLRVRPVYHWAVHRIHAHVALSVLALLLERLIEQACDDTWRNIRADLDRIKLAQLSSPHGEVWQVTEPSPEASNHLTCLETKNPPAILHLT
jgi:Transposase DDE domain